MNGSLAIAALPLLAMAASASGLGPPKDIWDPKVQAGLFTGRVLACPAPYEVTVAAWEFDGEGTWPLAAVDANAKGLRVENGVLRCTASAAKLELGWGNWERGAARALKTISFRGNQIAGAVIQARVRQSKPKATWRFQFRHRGDPNDTGAWGTAQGWGPPKLEAASNPQSTDWQVLSVACKQLAEADGFGVEIQGEPGNEIEIDHIRIVQEVWDIHARKVVTIPPGRIFSAVATVSINLDVWVNGTQIREDEVCGSMARYQHVAVDLKPHLKPGRNVICLREFLRMKHTPICWLQGAVQMVSGETIPVETGLDWKTSVKEAPGWLSVDFDDSKWLVPGKEDPTRYLRDMRPYTVYHPGRLPAYCGQVALENPYQKKLFYDESKPVKLRVRLPAGLAKPPVVAYAVWSDRTREQVAEGTANAPTTRTDDSLVYDLAIEKLPRGVYTVLLDAGEGRTRQETFIVVGRIPMPETEGRAWDADMKLTLVDQINCADPGDPHPFCDAGVFKPESASKVVTRGGLTYRESPVSPANQHSWFSYKFKFRTLGKPHWVVVEYPDDAPRLLEVEVLPLARRPIKGPYASETAWVAPGAQVGGKYPNTGKLQPLRFIVWSHELDACIVLTSAGEGSQGAAAARISVFEIERLPALRTHPAGRRFGLMTERASVMERTYGGSPDLRTPGRNPYLAWFDEAERYAQYCRFTGQNAYFMGSYQYTYDNPPSVALDTGAEGCSLVPEIRDVFITVLGANGIETFGAIEYRTDPRHWHKAWPAPHQVAESGADLMFQIDRNGHVQGGNYQRDNPMASPAALASMKKNLGHVVNRFSIYPTWKGLTLVLAPGWEGPVYDSADVSFDDQTIRLFEKETGIQVPVDVRDPQRFQKRYEFLVGPQSQIQNPKSRIADAWFAWRSEKVAQVHDAMAAMVKAARADLEYAVVVEYPVEKVWGKGQQPLLEMMRDVGYDPRAYAKRRAYSFGRDLWSFTPLKGGRAIGLDPWLNDPEAIRLFNDAAGERRWAFVRWGFDEWGTEPLLRADPPVWPGGYWINYGTPGHRYLAERFTRLLIDSDVDTLQYGFCDSTATVGGEQEMREFVKAFVSLPSARFTPITGERFDAKVVVKECHVGSDYYLLVANPSFADIAVSIPVRSQGDSPVTCIADGSPVKLKDGKTLAINLAPFGVTAFKGTEAVLRPVQTHVSEAAR